jgi:predicted RND superfamily exporter protein
MKKLIAGAIILVILCVAVTGATVGTSQVSTSLNQGQGIMADVRDVIDTHQTIQEQRQDIRQDIHSTNQGIRENLSAGREAIQDVRQSIRENLSTANGTIHEERHGMVTYVHQSEVALVDNVSDLHSQIQAERQSDQAQIANFTAAQQVRLVHYYDVQVAAHALMSMQDIAGDIGPRVAAIADDINTSESNITPFEQRIDDRTGFFRFLFGGDKVAANQINDQVAQNQQRIQTLEQLAQNSTLQPDVQQAMQDQITVLEQEQSRLSNLTAAETNSSGLLWWI